MFDDPISGETAPEARASVDAPSCDSGAVFRVDDGAPAPFNEAAASLWRTLSEGDSDALASALTVAAETGEAVEISLPADAGVRVFDLAHLALGELPGLVLCRETTYERNLRAVLAESRRRYKDLVETSSDFAWETGPDGDFVFVSPRGALGYRADDLVGQAPARFVVVADGAADGAEDQAAAPFHARERMDRVEIWFRRADGEPACLELTCAPLVDESGAWRGARGVCRDITGERERDAALAEARNRERLHAYVMHAIHDEVDPAKTLAGAAAAVARVFAAAAVQIYRFDGAPRHLPAAEWGAAPDGAGFEPALRRIESGEPDVEAEAGSHRVLLAGTRYRGEVSGALCAFREAGAPSWTEGERRLLCAAAGQVAIAIEQVAHHESLRRLSRTDPLTGLLNRRAFFDGVSKRLAVAGGRDRPGALIYLDLDNFKRVNDSLGHQKGDQVLRAVAELLTKKARTGDLVARLGGDEFALWLDGSDREGAEAKARVLLAGAAELRPFSAARDRPLGFSIGVAPYRTGNGEDMASLVARADGAMYDVKHAGKGDYRVAPPPDGGK